ncbi:DUF4176 domain-containing protein [Bacillus weihaiensis]|uniref:DUF4176 domain-containing protein n=1 Tax=Bacillus weihaiensis TaxID=1547283 RepID=A0A1L3MV35_9BACI|nr:DUF4176 domain-containing protein [Bacillus weihaiensis]APH06207.1 hypothetical protein A9C19_16465 [Bacillus weihaiensis]
MNEKIKLKTLAMEKVAQVINSLSNEAKIRYRVAINEFADVYLDDELVFQELYYAYKQERSSCELQCTNGEKITYRREHNEHVIQFAQTYFCLPEELFVLLITSCMEIMREVLPLGTVVELNPLHFIPEHQTSSPTKVVITKRFIAPTGYQTYFPYGGAIYPVGEMKKDTTIYFTEPLITNVIHTGYKDDMEEAFLLLIKEDFIVQKI